MKFGTMFGNLFNKKKSSSQERFATDPEIVKARNRPGLLDRMFRPHSIARIRGSRATKKLRRPTEVKKARKNQRAMHKIAACRPA